jgi:2,4-dienoyl-CoA reductase [(3E)-enoyl-CoA-producing], peroxisomal
MVHLGANACIIGRSVENTESVAKDMESCRPGARVLGIGAVDVRNAQSIQGAADRCVKELGAIDFVMWVSFRPSKDLRDQLHI